MAGTEGIEARKDVLRRFRMGNKFDDLPLFLTPQQLTQVTGEHVTRFGAAFSKAGSPQTR